MKSNGEAPKGLENIKKRIKNKDLFERIKQQYVVLYSPKFNFNKISSPNTRATNVNVIRNINIFVLEKQYCVNIK